MNDIVLSARSVSRHFDEAGGRLTVLDQVSLDIRRGERVAIMGPSGAGKSTLLHILGGLDTPSSGEVLLGNDTMSALDETTRGRLRNRMLGFVYQFHHLLPEFTALENVALPLLIGGLAPQPALQQASQLLQRVGLGARLTHKPGALSGGERQRAAVARALVTQPQCVLADEPTGNLDRDNAQRVFDLMLELNAERQTSLIVVTHEATLAQRMDRVLRLENGRVQ
ncbi:MAG: lipoprotein-releasing ABC transporter ATP-binding protein LolD [Gammaproteobacteria bacterium]|nr:lipoprotein-releasing ABC transporter ATP-binding protein LolD [Gammaproteobacteria bacterium]